MMRKVNNSQIKQRLRGLDNKTPKGQFQYELALALEARLVSDVQLELFRVFSSRIYDALTGGNLNSTPPAAQQVAVVIYTNCHYYFDKHGKLLHGAGSILFLTSMVSSLKSADLESPLRMHPILASNADVKPTTDQIKTFLLLFTPLANIFSNSQGGAPLDTLVAKLCQALDGLPLWCFRAYIGLLAENYEPIIHAANCDPNNTLTNIMEEVDSLVSQMDQNKVATIRCRVIEAMIAKLPTPQKNALYAVKQQKFITFDQFTQQNNFTSSSAPTALLHAVLDHLALLKPAGSGHVAGQIIDTNFFVVLSTVTKANPLNSCSPRRYTSAGHAASKAQSLHAATTEAPRHLACK